MNNVNSQDDNSSSAKVANSTVEALLCRLTLEPDNWPLRKSAALKLHEGQNYEDAANILWSAPEMPATDLDVAFAVKIVSRSRPNRAIRLIYEVLRRNEGKPSKNMAMARAMSLIGMPMQAARFYGAALAESSEHFDLNFEKQALWCDDAGKLMELWLQSDQDAKPPQAAPLVYFTEEAIELAELTDDVVPQKPPAVSPLSSTVAFGSAKPAPLPTSSNALRPATVEGSNQSVEPQKITPKGMFGNAPAPLLVPRR